MRQTCNSCKTADASGGRGLSLAPFHGRATETGSSCATSQRSRGWATASDSWAAFLPDVLGENRSLILSELLEPPALLGGGPFLQLQSQQWHRSSLCFHAHSSSLVLQLPSVPDKEPCDDTAAAAKSLQSCPTLRPQRRQPTRLPCPWDSPGKNTGMRCHFLLQCMKLKSESEFAQCRTLCDPMDGSLPSSWDFPGKSTGVGCYRLLRVMTLLPPTSPRPISPPRDPYTDFPGGAVAKTLPSQCRGLGFEP